ncbi:FAD-dependent oxidoreductase [Flavobacterium sp. Sd200]|uniref:NAD(P)/FAD-dependent oxidoreductase n=1 Tax=Flavobacterium sp. Sd200 TaxID=2692211 RepID=UPI00136C599F|nr:FAD-dependent oxidoreductase [Flavobacterium sp. Sd200]MXN93011.1 FAD-dependent oxidoreductase [Flavobacterium sp. Sd200]
MKDYLIVGGGLAGISFAETAYLNNKTFTIVTDTSQNSSLVAAGIYNPVILKRFSLPMDAKEHADYMKPFYLRIEQRLNIKFDVELPVFRKFASVEEQNNWFEAADKPTLEPFLSTKIEHVKYQYLPSPFGFGRVMHTGYVDTDILTESYHVWLKSNGNLLQETFTHTDLIIHNDYIEYKGITAKHIVFAEGFGLHTNPWFSYLPLDGTKGELLLIKAHNLKLDVAVNAGVFILPFGNDLYKVGATYEWVDKTPTPTVAGKAELLERLNEVITCNYEVIEHLAGIRPTVKDRKALVGTHHIHKNVHLLNGLGTRGVMLGPSLAKELFESIENNRPVKKDVNLNRFKTSVI